GMDFGLDRKARDECAGEAAVLAIDQPLRMDDHAGGEVGDDGRWLGRRCHEPGRQLEEALDRRWRKARTVEGDGLLGEIALVGLAVAACYRRQAEPARRIVGDDALDAGLDQLSTEIGGER